MNGNGNGAWTADTPEQVRAARIELQRSARQAERTASSVADSVVALARDAGLAVLGLADVAVRTLLDLPRMGVRLGQRAGRSLQAAPAEVGQGIDALVQRGYEVVSQVRHDSSVRSAVQRTDTARRRMRRTANSIGQAARAQAVVVQRSAAVLGRRKKARYRNMTMEELRATAARRGLDGRSSMSKDELVSALAR